MTIELTDENYSDFISKCDRVVFIDFYSPSCMPCQQLLPLLEQISSHYENSAYICKVNVAKNPKLAKKYKIRSVPFCVVIGLDKMVKQVELGLASVDRYFDMIDKTLNKPSKIQKFISKFFKS